MGVGMGIGMGWVAPSSFHIIISTSPELPIGLFDTEIIFFILQAVGYGLWVMAHQP